MVKVLLGEGRAVFEVEGLHKLWAFKSRIEVPLPHIRSVRPAPDVDLGWWKGLRVPGTHVPGLIVAGTYFQGGKRIFWDVCNPARAIVVELVDERYHELIIEVDDPSGVVARLQASMATAGERPAVRRAGKRR
jgi:hypothetical protein